MMNEDKCGEENRMEWKGLNLINLVFLFLNNSIKLEQFIEEFNLILKCNKIYNRL